MSNILFNRLNKPRITKYAPTLVGREVPFRPRKNSAITGNYIDILVKNWAGVSTGATSGVDLIIFGVEVKSKDILGDSEWTIGSMTFNDIIGTPYRDSALYQKLQALFLVEYNNNFCRITIANLFYMDNDETQTILEAGYEAARHEMISHQLRLKNQLITIGSQPLHNYKQYARIPGTPGFGFERCKSTNSFNFRITSVAMKNLVKLAVANNNSLFTFL